MNVLKKVEKLASNKHSILEILDIGCYYGTILFDHKRFTRKTPPRFHKMLCSEVIEGRVSIIIYELLINNTGKLLLANQYCLDSFSMESFNESLSFHYNDKDLSKYNKSFSFDTNDIEKAAFYFGELKIDEFFEKISDPCKSNFPEDIISIIMNYLFVYKL